MELTLKFPDGEKTYVQNTVNFITLKKALEWMERFTESQNKMMELIKVGIDGETKIDEQELDIFEPLEDLNFTADLIVDFFSGQFTYDDFIRYAYFENVAEFYKLGRDIWELAFEQKEQEEQKTAGKKRKRTS